MSVKLRMLSAYYSDYSSPRENQNLLSTGQFATALTILISVIWALSFPFGFPFSLWALTGLGFLLAAFGLAFPAAGLLGIGILVALDPVTQVYLPETGFYRWNTLNYWLLLIILLNLPLLLRLNDPHTRLMQIFFLLLGLQMIYSPRLTTGAQKLLDLSTIFGMMVYFIRAVQKKDAMYWFGVMVGVLAAVGGLVFNIQFENLPYLNPNAWGFFPCTAMLAICLGMREARGSPGRVAVLLVLFGANAGWLFLSGSRGNMLIGLVGVCYLLWQTRRMAWTPVILTVALLVGYWATLQMQEQRDYALSRLELFFDDQSTLAHRTSGRSSLAQRGLEIFLSNPLGTGTGSFRTEFAEIDTRGRRRPSHSGWVNTLAENGIFGILILIAFIASFAWVGNKKRAGSDLFSFGLFISATIAVVFISREYYAKGMWMIAAAGSVLLHFETIPLLLADGGKSRILNRYYYLRDRWQTPEPPAASQRPALGPAGSRIDAPRNLPGLLSERLSQGEAPKGGETPPAPVDPGQPEPAAE